MKALEILKLIKEGSFTTYLDESLIKIDEAIKELEELELKLDILTVNYKCLEEQLIDECDLIKTNKEHFYFLKQNERDFIVDRLKSRFQLK